MCNSRRIQNVAGYPAVRYSTLESHILGDRLQFRFSFRFAKSRRSAKILSFVWPAKMSNKRYVRLRSVPNTHCGQTRKILLIRERIYNVVVQQSKAARLSFDGGPILFGIDSEIMWIRFRILLASRVFRIIY